MSIPVLYLRSKRRRRLDRKRWTFKTGSETNKGHAFMQYLWRESIEKNWKGQFLAISLFFLGIYLLLPFLLWDWWLVILSGPDIFYSRLSTSFSIRINFRPYRCPSSLLTGQRLDEMEYESISSKMRIKEGLLSVCKLHSLLSPLDQLGNIMPIWNDFHICASSTISCRSST